MIDQCLRRNGDKKCVFKGESNALDFMRRVAAVVHQLANVDGPDSKMGRLARFLKALDDREGNMIPPFRELLGREPTNDEMVSSLEYVTEKRVSKRIPKIQTKEWKEYFDEHYWRPFFDLCEKTKRKPNVTDYTEIFLRFPDIVAIGQILASIEHAHLNDMDMPIIFLWAGASHTQKVVEWIKEFPYFKTIVEESRQDTSGGSCIRRSGRQREAVFTGFTSIPGNVLPGGR
jgi:hypothetical protein